DALDVFPEAQFLLIEPQGEMRVHLDALSRERPNVRWLECAVGAEKTTMALTIWDDLAGSSLLPSAETAKSWGYAQRIVRVETIDSVLAGAVPNLVKLDIQGYEIEALKGAESLFGRTELFIAETSFFE